MLAFSGWLLAFSGWLLAVGFLLLAFGKRWPLAVSSPRDDVSGSFICFGFAEAFDRLALAPLRLRWRFCAFGQQEIHPAGGTGG